MPRLLVIGLDCATPETVFKKGAGPLPHLDALRAAGQWGGLQSVIPPITVPAWACMTTGRDPGRLGVYGFRNRTAWDYESQQIADSTSIREPHVWDRLSAAGGESIVLGVPPGFPVQPLRGCRTGCFLTPTVDARAPWTWPPELGPELHAVCGGYETDVPQFRTDDKSRLLADLFRQSDKQFDAALHLARSRPWQLLMLVNIALDRLHHGFWKEFDPRHRKYVPGSPWEDAIPRFYRRLDQRIGELLSLLDARDNVLVVSDHGARPIDGGIAVNQWLIDRGWLTVRQRPNQPTPLSKLDVDWSRTRAWSEGGYYARVFINRAGREPQGIVAAEGYEAFRSQLAAELAGIPDDAGRPLQTRAYRPEELYPEARGFPPDLLVLWGDLAWRSIGSVGHARVQVLENDTGPDEANHARRGIYILAGPGVQPAANAERSLLDVAPTMLSLLGLPVPADLPGRVM